MNRTTLRFAVAFLLLATVAYAQGRGNGGGKGGGGSQPPPDPAIVFVDGDVKVMNDDGSNETTVLRVGRREEVRGPAWSPDNRQFVVSGVFAGARGIHVVEADGSGARLVVPLASTSTQFVDWSAVPTPDGLDKLAFYAHDPGVGTRDIWIANPDGSGVCNLTDTPNANEFYPTFSRDGRKIAFVRDIVELVVADLVLVDGAVEIANEFVAYTSPTHLAFPAWAQTQDLIAVSEMRNGVMRLVILDVYGLPGIPFVVTATSGGDERWASFAPDDSGMVFHRNGPGGGIIVLGLDGSGETRIASKGYDPRWRR